MLCGLCSDNGQAEGGGYEFLPGSVQFKHRMGSELLVSSGQSLRGRNNFFRKIVGF